MRKVWAFRWKPCICVPQNLFYLPVLYKFTSKTKGLARAQSEVYDFLRRTNNSRDRCAQCILQIFSLCLILNSGAKLFVNTLCEQLAKK